ncbi:MAG: PEP-CTERM sorting domain-containing protein, partial [Rhodopila sp.]
NFAAQFNHQRFELCAAQIREGRWRWHVHTDRVSSRRGKRKMQHRPGFAPIAAIVSLSGTLPDTSATPFYKNTFSYPTTLSFSGYTYTATQVSHPEPPKSNTVSVLVSGLALAAGAYDITFYGTGLILDDFSSDAQVRQNGYFVYQSSRTNDGDGFVRYKSLGFDLIGTSVAAPEPGSMLLLSTGLAGLAAFFRLRIPADRSGL